MRRRECLVQLIQAEKRCIEAAKHDGGEELQIALGNIRLAVYERMMKSAVEGEFPGNDSDVDELKSAVDEIAHHYEDGVRSLIASLNANGQ